MRLPRPPSLVSALIVLATLGALSFQGFMLAEGRERALALAELRAANRAHAIADRIAGVVRQTDLLLLDAREHLEEGARAGGPSAATAVRTPALQALLRRHAERVPLVARLVVTDADGRFLYSSAHGDAVPEGSVADRAYFQAQRDAGADRLLLSTSLQARLDGRWALVASRRLTDRDGRFAGLVQATLGAETLGALMGAVDREHWTFALYDGDRRLVARWPGGAEAIGQASADPGLAALLAAPDARWRGPGPGEPAPRVWASRPVDATGLVTVAGYAQPQALAQWRRDLRINLLVAALVAAGCAGLVVLLAKAARAQRRLRSREAHFRTVFDASPAAMAVLRDGAVADANLRYRELLQVPPGQEPTPWALAPPVQPDGQDSLARGASLCARALGGGLQREIWRCRRASGEAFEAEVTALPLRHEGRALLVMVVRDLTEQRRMEERLHQAQKLDALGQLAGGVAHDFNNMLSAILASAELIAEGTDEAERRELGAAIVAAAQRAGQLTRKLLSFARRGKLLSTPVDVHAVVRETLALLERTFDRRIQLVADLGAPRATVVGDPSQLQSAVLNLAVNARDAMPAGGAIRFATEVVELAGEACALGASRVEPGTYLCLRVEDQGTGIRPEDLPRIFDPFFTTKEVGKGTGLGLAAVFGAMASHRGAVTVESEVGRGSTFALYLPLADPAVTLRPAPEPARSGAGAVLLVDDEELVRAALARQLESLGYETLAEGDPRRAIETFAGCHARLSAVLLDQVMPDLTGAEVAARFLAIDPAVPLVLLSGFPRNAQVEELLARGACAFLQKPFERRELAEVLERFARKPAAPPAAPAASA